MKIQIVKTFETDGNWLKMYIDGNPIMCRNLANRDKRQCKEAEAEIEAAYQLAIKNATEKKANEVIKEIEI